LKISNESLIKKEFDLRFSIQKEIVQICEQYRLEVFQTDNSFEPANSDKKEFEIDVIAIHSKIIETSERFHRSKHTIFGHGYSKGTFGNIEGVN